MMKNNFFDLFRNQEIHSPVKVTSNGIEVEIEREILDALGIDPAFMSVEIHKTSKEELDIV